MVTGESENGFTFLTDEAYLTFSVHEDPRLIRAVFINGYEGMCEDWFFKDDLPKLIEALQRFNNIINPEKQ